MEPRTPSVLAVALLASLALAGCLGALPQDPAGDADAGPGPDGAPTAAHPAVVAAAHRLAAEAGADVLRNGGNAVDAAAAVQWALNVVEPEFSGVGGGAFILIYLADEDRLVVVDGRETAVRGTEEDQYAASDDVHPDRMGYSVGVPGTLAAFDLAVQNWGRLPLNASFDPAIRLAEDGFTVYPYLTATIAANQDEIRSWPPTARIFLQGAVCPEDDDPCTGGVPLLPGQTLVQPDLARTFRTLQDEGPAAFYDGAIGEAVAETVRDRDGSMILEDLRAYRALEREPLVLPFRGHEVATAPPPAGGIIVLEALGILEPWDLGERGRTSADGLHGLIEALRLAYADRAAHVADPAFVAVPTDGLLDAAYLAERRARMDWEETQDHPPGDPWVHDDGDGAEAGTEDGAEVGTGGSASAAQARSGAPATTYGAPATTYGAPATTYGDPDGHTTHFSVVDHAGNVVSVTSTIESAFGTGMVVPGWGFLLNDELTDFTWETGDVNSPAPRKRPRSSMTPTIVLSDGRPVLAVGSPGGTAIPSVVAEVVLNVVEHGMDVEAAVEAGRFAPRDHPGVLWDRELPPEAATELSDRGHRFTRWSIGIGNVHALWKGPDGAWQGWADSRRHQGAVVVVQP